MRTLLNIWILLFAFGTVACVAQDCVVLGPDFLLREEVSYDSESEGKLEFLCESGIKYRVGVCGVKKHKNVSLKIFNENGQVVFDNLDYYDVNIWDFRVSTPKKLVFEVRTRNGKSLTGKSLVVGEKSSSWNTIH